MGYHEDMLAWIEGDVQAARAREIARRRPRCGITRWPGSHITCVCLADHDGLHEDDLGETWGQR